LEQRLEQVVQPAGQLAARTLLELVDDELAAKACMLNPSIMTNVNIEWLVFIIKSLSASYRNLNYIKKQVRIAKSH